MTVRSATASGVPISPSSVIIPVNGTLDIYNTADQTTNYERFSALYAANVLRMVTNYAGTGVQRDLRIGVAASAGSLAPATYANYSAVSISSVTGSSSGAGPFHIFQSTSSASSATPTIFSLAPTLNQSGTAGYTALDINPTETTTGSGTKLLQRWAVNGTALAYVTNQGGINTGTGVASVTGYFFNTVLGGAADLSIVRDAGDILAQRRAAAAQAFRIYNTYTDASNYERQTFGWGGSVAFVVTEQAGTGAARALTLGTSGSASIFLRTNGTNRWEGNSSGNFLPVASDSYSIGGGSNWLSALYANYHVLKDGVTAPAAVSGQAILYVDTADGDLKIIFGDGTIKTIVTDT